MKKGIRTMLESLVPVVVIVGIWLLLQLVILPKLGVPT
jgi:hypothetical protein